MYLIDTNVWLERLLNRAKSEEVGTFLDQVTSRDLLVTDFTFHSIGVILGRLGRLQLFTSFTKDVFVDGEIAIVALEPEDMPSLVNVMNLFHLDFDDAYQYLAAEKYGAVLLSFDKDFDRTTLGHKTPAEILTKAH